MKEAAETAHPIWRALDVLVYLPLGTLFLSFWIFVITMEHGPAALYEYYAGSRNATDAHCGNVLFASVVFGLYSATLFLPKRRLFGAISRRMTIIAAVLLFLLSVGTFFASAFALAGM
jgi:hypothetical protein